MARKMKDSGIEWIGALPTDFTLYKLKYLLSSPLCYGANESGTLYSDILPRYIRITDISPNGTLKNSGMLSLDESSAQNYMLHEGDILFARSGATVGKSFIYHNYYGRAAYAGYLIKASFNRLVLPEFVYYYTCSSAYEIWKNSIFIQSTIQNIGADRYSNLPISVPNSIDKQLRIVHYLNDFCSKFDAIIYNLQTSIEEYKKLKQSVITQAVTKGVRGEREMKPTDFTRWSEIPFDWDLKRVKSCIASISSGLSAVTDDANSEESGKFVLRTSAVSSGFFAPTEVKPVLKSAVNRLICPVEPDTLIVSRMNTASMVGACAYVANNHPSTFLPDKLWKIKFLPSYHTKYMWYALNSVPAKSWFSELATGASSSMQNISINDFTSNYLPIPAFSEQKEIANYLDAKCAEIDGLVAKKELLVKELESYKKSLIYEVVTGKREV